MVPASSLIHYSSVQCTGLEGRLTDCMMESSNVTACSHSDDVVVMCKQCKLFLFVHFVICHQAVHRKESGAYNIMFSDYTMNTEYCKTIQLFVSSLLFNEHLILFIIPRHCPTITNIQLTNQISKKISELYSNVTCIAYDTTQPCLGMQIHVCDNISLCHKEITSGKRV